MLEFGSASGRVLEFGSAYVLECERSEEQRERIFTRLGTERVLTISTRKGCVVIGGRNLQGRLYESSEGKLP